MENTTAEKTNNNRNVSGGNDRNMNNNNRNMIRKNHKKVCYFCVNKSEEIDYKDAQKLRRYVSDRAKILPRRVTGVCASHQRELTTAIKRARQLALLPYLSE